MLLDKILLDEICFNKSVDKHLWTQMFCTKFVVQQLLGYMSISLNMFHLPLDKEVGVGMRGGNNLVIVLVLATDFCLAEFVVRIWYSTVWFSNKCFV